MEGVACSARSYRVPDGYTAWGLPSQSGDLYAKHSYRKGIQRKTIARAMKKTMSGAAIVAISIFETSFWSRRFIVH